MPTPTEANDPRLAARGAACGTMIRHGLAPAAIAFVTLFVALVGHDARAEQPESAEATPRSSRHADQVARFMAGLPQDDATSPYKRLEATKAWKKHRVSMDQHWQTLQTRRLKRMQQWSREEFAAMCEQTLPLFYPFSGPDFVNAYAFYPSAPRYVFAALESVHFPPDFLGMTTSKLGKALLAMDYGLRDIYSKGYFITSHMQKDLIHRPAEGAVPSLYVLLARLGNELLDVEKVTVTPDGELVAVDRFGRGRVRGMRIRFRKRGSTDQRELLYFSANLKSRALKKAPGFMTFLRSLKPANTFVKAASYLMAGDDFDMVRSVVLGVSHALFQDDTGVPLREVDRLRWDIQLFGTYSWPIAGFGKYTRQQELMDLYKRTDPAQIRQLPFTMGYHQRNERKQSHMLLTLRPARAAPPGNAPPSPDL